MKKILFFVQNQKREVIETLFDKSEYSIEFFENSKKNLVNLPINDSDSELIYISDDINFLQIAFRLYNQTFDNFIYFYNQEKNSMNEFEEFDIFLTSKITNIENITKPIYVLGEKPKTELDINFRIITSLKDINSIEKIENKSQKIFYFKNKFFISEFINFNYKIVRLDDSEPKGNLGLRNFFYGFEDSLIDNIEYILRLFDEPNKDITPYINKVKVILDELSQSEQEKFIIHFKFLINNLSNENTKNYLCSFLANLKFFTSEMFDSLIQEIMNNNLLSLENKYFLFWQYTRVYFTKPLENQVSQEVFWSFYRNIYNEYKKTFENIEFIPKEERNKNLIFLFTSQFLGEAHAPTKNILDVAYSLVKDFNKEVLLINTAEVLTKASGIPFYNQIVANKVAQYSNINQIPYKDITIPFYQSLNEMPNMNDILNILLIVQEYKPYFILSLSTILTADIASNLVSTITFPTGSNLTISESQIHIKAGKVSEEQIKILNSLDISQQSLIQISGWKKDEDLSKVNYNKKDFNLPEDKFLLTVVGNRLNDEIREDFLSMLFETIPYNTHIVFVGLFSNYEKYSSKYHSLKENSTYIGYQEHLYDVLKLFDLFVNPGRLGGGMGGFLSLINSLPLVTLDYGDVYSNAKGNFGVKSYEDMKNIIIKHATDSLYHEEQSKLAYNIYDSSNSMEENLTFILSELEKNSYFK